MSGISGYSRFSPSPEKERSKTERPKSRYTRIESSSQSSKYDPYSPSMRDDRFKKREKESLPPNSSSQILDQKWERGKDIEKDRSYLSSQDRKALSREKPSNSSLFLTIKEKDTPSASRMIRTIPEAKENPAILDAFFERKIDLEPGAWNAKLLVFNELKEDFQSKKFFLILLQEAPDLDRAKLIWDKWQKSPRYSSYDSSVQIEFLYKAAQQSPEKGISIVKDFIINAKKTETIDIDIKLYNACLYLVKNIKWTPDRKHDQESSQVSESSGASISSSSLGIGSQSSGDRGKNERVILDELKDLFYSLAHAKIANNKTFSLYIDLSRLNRNFGEAGKAYSLAEANQVLDTTIHQNYIDSLVDEAKPETLRLADQIIDEAIIPAWPDRCRKIRDKTLDLHDFSHGCGYLWLRRCIQDEGAPESFTVICGQGAGRDPRKYLAFNSYLTKKISNDPIFENWKWTVPQDNPGIIIFTKNRPSISQMPNEPRASAPPPEEKRRERNIHDLFAAVARKK